jgi:hypothetical protein
VVPDRRGRARLPLWVHQLLEYVLAALFVEMGLHLPSGGRDVLLAAGGVTFATVLLTRGPVGPVKLLGPAVHRALDALRGLALIAAPFVVHTGGVVPAIVIVLAGGVTLWSVVGSSFRPLPIRAHVLASTSAPRASSDGAAPAAGPSGSGEGSESPSPSRPIGRPASPGFAALGSAETDPSSGEADHLGERGAQAAETVFRSGVRTWHGLRRAVAVGGRVARSLGEGAVDSLAETAPVAARAAGRATGRAARRRSPRSAPPSESGAELP